MHAELHTIVDQVEAADSSQRSEAKTLDALGQLHDEAEHHLVAKTPWHERNILLRAKADESGLNIRDEDLAAVVATARARLRGQKKGISSGDVFHIPEERWLAQDLIASRTMKLMVALQKVGMSAIPCELAEGRGEFIERFSLSPPCPKVIIVDTDQPFASWREVMVPNGLMVCTGVEEEYKTCDPVVEFYTREHGLRLDETSIEQITAH